MRTRPAQRWADAFRLLDRVAPNRPEGYNIMNIVVYRRTASLLALAAALAAAPGGARAQQAQNGEQVYAQVCMCCRAESGGGKPGVHRHLAGSEWENGPPARRLVRL